MHILLVLLVQIIVAVDVTALLQGHPISPIDFDLFADVSMVTQITIIDDDSLAHVSDHCLYICTQLITEWIY